MICYMLRCKPKHAKKWCNLLNTMSMTEQGAVQNAFFFSAFRSNNMTWMVRRHRVKIIRVLIEEQNDGQLIRKDDYKKWTLVEI